MAIRPFRAVHFGASQPLRDVTTPPHDCFTLEERDRFVARHPKNIARIVRGIEQAGDGEGPEDASWHKRAAKTMQDWLADGTLVREAHPALYLYTITHGPADDRRTLTALVARVEVDSTGTRIRPHEATLTRPKKDRLRLRQAARCDVEPIWMLYRDPNGWVNEVASSNAIDELLRFTDDDGHEHRLWRVDRREAVGEILAQFEERTLVIADGHHRYQTALEDAAGHPAEARQRGAILTMLVRDDDPGLSIEATHRMLTTLPFPVGEALQRLPAWTSASCADPLMAVGSLRSDETILVTALGAWRLRLRPAQALERGLGALDALAVSRLQERALAPWGFEAGHDALRFTRDAQAAIEAVRSGAMLAVFLLPPETPASVLDVASSGRLMPPKATYFVPKPRSGLLLAPLDE